MFWNRSIFDFAKLNPSDLPSDMLETTSTVVQVTEEIREIYARLMELPSVTEDIEELYSHYDVMRQAVSKQMDEIRPLSSRLEALPFEEVSAAVSPAYNWRQAALTTCADTRVLSEEVGKCRILAEIYEIVREVAHDVAVR